MTAALHRFILPALILFWCVASPALAQTAGAGISFVAALPTTALSSQLAPTVVTLLLAAEAECDVAMIPSNGAPSSTATIPAGGTLEIVLDSATVLAPHAAGVWQSSLRLTGTTPFTATLLIDRPFVAEAVALIPDAEQQREAFIVGSDVNDGGGMMIVIGLLDSTRVTITPAVPTVDGHAAGIPYTVTLGLGDVYQTLTTSAGSEGDLSGTRVESSAPVGVLGGTMCSDFPTGAVHACNPLVEAMPHVGCLGREFVLAPLAKGTRAHGRLVATRDSTVVLFGGTLPLGTLRQGKYLDLSADTAVRIVASQPVVVVQYVLSTATSRSVSPYGDPAMMVVPPVGSSMRAVRTVLPALGPRTQSLGTAEWEYYCQIVCDSSAFPSIRVNGAIPGWGRVDGVEGYRLGVLPLGLGALTITCDSSIGVQLYGYSLQDAFGTAPLACATRRPVEPPPPVRDTSRYLRLRLVGDTVIPGGQGELALLLDSAGGFLPGDSIALDLVVGWNYAVAVLAGAVELIDSAWSVEPGGMDVAGEERRVVIRLGALPDTNGGVAAPSRIARIGLLGALGAERSWCSITPVPDAASPRTVDTSGDLLVVTGQCIVGGTRLVGVAAPLLRSITVEPLMRDITVTVDGGGLACAVALVDPLGRRVSAATVVAGSEANEVIRFAGLAAGWYLLTARTSDGRTERQAVVVP